MSIEGSNDKQENALETELMKKVPMDKAIGNVTLLTKLRWNKQKYWDIRNGLIDQGRLEKGRGQGGSVKRVITISPQETSASALAPCRSLLISGLRNPSFTSH